jgi:hypothetical protein
MFLPAQWQLYIFGQVPVVNPQTGERTGEWVNPLSYDVSRALGGVWDFFKDFGIWIIILVLGFNWITKGK